MLRSPKAVSCWRFITNRKYNCIKPPTPAPKRTDSDPLTESLTNPTASDKLPLGESHVHPTQMAWPCLHISEDIAKTHTVVSQTLSEKQTTNQWHPSKIRAFRNCPPILFSYWIYNIHLYIIYIMVAQTVRNLPTMQDTWVQSLGQEDPLEKGMATHSSILACRIPWTEEPGGLQSMRLQRVGHDWATNSNFSYLCCYSSYSSYYWHISHLSIDS